MAKGSIEHWPHNGNAQHVVVIENDKGMRLCLAYPSRERAEQKLPQLVAGFSKHGA